MGLDEARALLAEAPVSFIGNVEPSELFEGKAEDVIRDPEVRRVYLGDMYG